MYSKINVSPRKLPNPLSGLTEVALEDLEKAEASRLHKVNMNQWHAPQADTQKCEVCFAGGVIAFTLEGATDRFLSPGSFDAATSHKLLALDNIRNGAVREALENIGVVLPPGMEAFVPIPPYRDDPVGFKAALHDLADDLRAHNL